MNYANTTWDVVDLVSVILEIRIVETDDAEEIWRTTLHINGMAPADVEQQAQAFKEKWTTLRPLVSV
eukprot:874925-Prorocentrum_lima.AAC.1